MLLTRAELIEAKRKRTKRNRKIWISVLSVFIAFVVFWSIFSFTDVILGVPVQAESSPLSNGWAMFHRDLVHSGFSGSNNVIPAGNLKWKFSTGAGIHSSPAIVDGTVYIGSEDSHLYAIDAVTGQQKWAVQMGSWVESSPVVSEGVVYVGCNDGYLYALKAGTGEKIWSFKTRYAIRSTPAVAGGMVYFGADDRQVYALDAATGKKIWSSPTGDMVISSPAVSKGILVVGSGDGMAYTFNAKNGRARLRYDISGSVTNSPAIKDGAAYFVDSLGYFYAMDISKKNWLWENKIRYYWNPLYVYGVAPKPPPPSGYLWTTSVGRGISSASSITISENNAYLGLGNNIVSVDLTTHKIAWTFKTANWVTSSPTVIGNTVFIGGYDGYLYALDKTSGNKIWSYKTGDKITSSPAVVDGTLFFASHDGTLYAFN